MSDIGVGFIGLGNIGGPMAGRLVDWPGGLTVCDVNPAATEAFAAQGARVASTPSETAERAEVICVMVRDDAQVDAVVNGPDGILRTAKPGTVVAVHSTISAATAVRLNRIATEQGVTVVDATVTGGPDGAAAGALALMIGGPLEAVDKLREPLGRFASLIAHVGDVGAGTKAKLIRNLITYASFTAAAEGMVLAEAAGIDLRQLGDVVRHSDKATGGPGAVMMRSTMAPLSADDPMFTAFTHARALAEKDLGLVLALGDEVNVDLPAARLALDTVGNVFGVGGTK